jgi:hypothetical protein
MIEPFWLFDLGDNLLLHLDVLEQAAKLMLACEL